MDKDNMISVMLIEIFPLLIIALFIFLVWKYLLHDWGEWALVDEKSCKWVRYCKRCGMMDQLHHYYILLDRNEKCEIHKECINCKKRELHTTNVHTYIALPKNDNCEIFEECTNCKNKKIKNVMHRFSEKWASDYGLLMRKLYNIIKIKTSEDMLKDLFYYADIDYIGVKNMLLDDAIKFFLTELIKKNDATTLLFISKKLLVDKVIEATDIPLPDLNKLYLSDFFWNNNENVSCTIEEKCIDCSSSSFKEKHDIRRSDFLTDNKCSKVKYCLNCAKIDSYIEEHSWGSPIYLESDTCDQVRRCYRCNKTKQEGYQVHVWSEWTYIANRDCLKIRKCQRCQKTEQQAGPHLWVHQTRKESYFNSATGERTYYDITYSLCTRCGLER